MQIDIHSHRTSERSGVHDFPSNPDDDGRGITQNEKQNEQLEGKVKVSPPDSLSSFWEDNSPSVHNHDGNGSGHTRDQPYHFFGGPCCRYFCYEIILGLLRRMCTPHVHPPCIQRSNSQTPYAPSVPLVRRLTPDQRRILCRSLIIIFMIITISFTLLDLLILHRHLNVWLDSTLDWLSHHPGAGGIAFVGIFLVGSLCFFPVALLSLGAGYVYIDLYGLSLGIIIAFLVCYMGLLIGAAVCFVRSRYLMRQLIQRFSKRYPIVRAVDRAFGTMGFRLFLLLRLSPAMPFNALNYIGGITAVSFRDYWWATCVGVVPGLVWTIFVGATFGTVDNYGTDGNKRFDQSSLRKGIVLGLGISLGVMGLVGTGIYARRELTKIILAEQNEIAEEKNRSEELTNRDCKGIEEINEADNEENDSNFSFSGQHIFSNFPSQTAMPELKLKRSFSMEDLENPQLDDGIDDKRKNQLKTREFSWENESAHSVDGFMHQQHDLSWSQISNNEEVCTGSNYRERVISNPHPMKNLETKGNHTEALNVLGASKMTHDERFSLWTENQTPRRSSSSTDETMPSTLTSSMDPVTLFPENESNSAAHSTPIEKQGNSVTTFVNSQQMPWTPESVAAELSFVPKAFRHISLISSISSPDPVVGDKPELNPSIEMVISTENDVSQISADMTAKAFSKQNASLQQITGKPSRHVPASTPSVAISRRIVNNNSKERDIEYGKLKNVFSNEGDGRRIPSRRSSLQNGTYHPKSNDNSSSALFSLRRSSSFQHDTKNGEDRNHSQNSIIVTPKRKRANTDPIGELLSLSSSRPTTPVNYSAGGSLQTVQTSSLGGFPVNGDDKVGLANIDEAAVLSLTTLPNSMDGKAAKKTHQIQESSFEFDQLQSIRRSDTDPTSRSRSISYDGHKDFAQTQQALPLSTFDATGTSEGGNVPSNNNTKLDSFSNEVTSETLPPLSWPKRINVGLVKRHSFGSFETCNNSSRSHRASPAFSRKHSSDQNELNLSSHSHSRYERLSGNEHEKLPDTSGSSAVPSQQSHLKGEQRRRNSAEFSPSGDHLESNFVDIDLENSEHDGNDREWFWIWA